jgi:hypothetical protein
MPRSAAAKPQVEEAEVEETEAETEETERDYTVYADKPITASMADFHTWLNDEVGDLSKMDTERIVALAGTLRMEFQRSDFNQEQRDLRKAQRAEAAAAANTEEAEGDEDETKPAAKPGRKPAAAKPAATDKATTATKPASRRGKPAAAAAAPY